MSPLIQSTPLNVEDVASQLGLGRNTVYKLARTGELGSYRVGRKLLFSQDDVNRYLDAVHANGKSGMESASSASADLEEKKMSLDTAFDLPKDELFELAGNDVVCDLVCNWLNTAGYPSTHVYAGSYTALVNLYAGKIDAALVHLYDAKTNSYNTPFVQRIAPGLPVVSIRIMKRSCGFIVSRGNPLHLKTWYGLLNSGVRLANTQRGCGSRVLLDEKLMSLEARPSSVAGYSTKYATPYQAALAVARGESDVALGTKRIAEQIPGVDYIPMMTESVDLVVVKRENTRSLVRALRSLGQDESFRAQVAALCDCDASTAGAVVFEC